MTHAPPTARRSSAAPGARETIDVLDPATGGLLERIPAGDAPAAREAVGRARAAQPGWARVAPAERGAALRRAAEAVRARAGELAELQTRENGRPLAESRASVEAGIGTLLQYAELGPLHGGRALAGSWEAIDMARPEPRGVAVALVPWNDPVPIACGAVGACLATGNAVVLKPSEKTPLSGRLLVEAMSPHLPADVLVLALGDARMGRPLVAHPGVDLVLHTGSVSTGREIGEVCGRNLTKAVLELGGKDPLVVDGDVDPGWAADQAAAGAFANAGQVCTSVERIYVHERVADDFVEALVRRAQDRVLGPGLDPGTTMGPLIDAGQREVVARHVDAARAAGAEVLCGGVVPDGPGFFYPPTVLTGVEDSMEVMREETFGPVAAVRVVPSFDEALAAAGAGGYGLAATVLTGCPAHAQRAVRELEVGTVKVNAVWGGAPGGSAEPRRASGSGLGYGPGLLDEVTALKVVHLVPAPWPS